MFQFSKFIATTMSLIVFSSLSFAHEEPPELEIWYQALSPVDRAAISGLLSEDALIDLQDLGIKQSKDEFVDSLDSWEDAIEGGSISYKFDWMESHDLDKAVALVCYHFSSGEMMTKEIFVIEEGKITSSAQMKLSDKCENI